MARSSNGLLVVLAFATVLILDSHASSKRPRYCQVQACLKRPSYGPEGGHAVACSSHRLLHHVDVINSRCSYAGGCLKRAYFAGEDNGWRPAFCGSHRRPSDVNVVLRGRNHTREGSARACNCSERQPLCEWRGTDGLSCWRRARYAAVGMARGQRCSLHKEKNMASYPPTCSRTGGCKRKAAFASAEETAPTACSLHRREGDVNLVRLNCAVEGCLLSASFGKCKHHPLHCSFHRDYQERDLIHGCCSRRGCYKSPTYGSLFERPQRCAYHRTAYDLSISQHKALLASWIDAFRLTKGALAPMNSRDSQDRFPPEENPQAGACQGKLHNPPGLGKLVARYPDIAPDTLKSMLCLLPSMLLQMDAPVVLSSKSLGHRPMKIEIVRSKQMYIKDLL